MHLSPRFYQLLVRPKFSVEKYIFSHLRPLIDPRKKTLDFGCGTGDLSQLIDSKKYVGVDIEDSRIKLAKEYHPSYSFRTLRGSKLPFRNQEFDQIIIVAVMHHISDEKMKILTAELLRVLNKKGKIIVLEPCLLKHTFIANWFMKKFDDGKYIRPEKEYFSFWKKGITKKLARFKKYALYNEVLFTVTKT